jgi:DNA helicase-2/ATP-dependent DNA helicase PcrA
VEVHKVNPENILAITFSVKAKENMQQRLGDTGAAITIDTFHGLGNKILKESNYNYYFNKIKPWQQKTFINDIVIKDMQIADMDTGVKTNDILRYIAYQKNNLNTKPEPIKDMPYGLHIMDQILHKYDAMKKQNKIMDFNDMLFNTYKLLSGNGAEREKYQDRYQYILVDEFQDTNKAMYEILRLLGKKHNNVFVVGDPLQNIYEFNLSNNDYLINFYKDWLDTKVISLNTNYRSSTDIVAYSNNLMQGTKETTHIHYIESVANKVAHMKPTISVYVNEEEEADKIAQKILAGGYNFSDVAILTRTNYMIQAIERGLFKNNIPYEVIGGKTFYEQKEIQDMINYLKLIADKNNDDAFRAIYNTPNRYLGSIFLNEITAYATRYKESLFDSMSLFPRSNEWRYKKGIGELENLVFKMNVKIKKGCKVGDLMIAIRNDLEYDKYISGEEYENNDRNEKVENLDAFVTIANRYDDLGAFLQEIDNIVGFARNDEELSKVKVMTIHKSKGLEYPVVFIASVNNHILPHIKSDNENEERRLLYVAMTRAENELHISSTATYHNTAMDISPFLLE